MSLLGRKHRIYTPQEAYTVRRMLQAEGSRELALGIIKNSQKRFREDDRRALHKELDLLRKEVLTFSIPAQFGGIMTWMYNPGLDRADPEKDAFLKDIRTIEWQHSKKSYSTEEWQKNNRKKEYRRSAKNHYS